jgi:hypothetical protein
MRTPIAHFEAGNVPSRRRSSSSDGMRQYLLTPRFNTTFNCVGIDLMLNQYATTRLVPQETLDQIALCIRHQLGNPAHSQIASLARSFQPSPTYL